MKNTWYICFLLLALAALGFSVEQKAVPNQEIVIQFTEGQVTVDQTNEAIALVRSQLATVDAENIRIQESGNGALKITYYSEIEVSEIEKIFDATEVTLENAFSSTSNTDSSEPFEKGLQDYQLDVYEIQEGTDLANTSGNVIELKSETTRFYTPDIYVSAGTESTEQQNTLVKLAFVIQRNVALATDTTSYKIPEVRAGPQGSFYAFAKA